MISQMIRGFSGLALVTLSLLPGAVRAYDWPASAMPYVDGESPVLEFRGDLITLQDKVTQDTYTAFEGNLNGAEWKDAVGTGRTIFMVDGDTDKSTVAAVLTAYSTGMKFRIQYERHNLFNRDVMLVRSFRLVR